MDNTNENTILPVRRTSSVANFFRIKIQQPNTQEKLQNIFAEKENETGQKVNDLVKAMIEDLKDRYNFIVANGEDREKQKEVINAIHQFHLTASSIFNYNGEKLDPAPSLLRPGSAGLNISDIADILFDEKMKQSDSHKKITNHITSSLLNLNKKIPTSENCHPDKSTNAAHLLKWIGKHEVTSSVEKNLQLFKNALINLQKLLEIA